MAILTGLPASIAQGDATGTVTFDFSDFMTAFSSAIPDSYFQTESNIKSVVFNYRSEEGKQPDSLVFNNPTYEGEFSVSDTARIGALECHSITLIDNDGGSYSIKRSKFAAAVGSATFFDSETTAPPPLTGSGDIAPAHNVAFSFVYWLRSVAGSTMVLFDNQASLGGSQGIYLTVKGAGGVEFEMQGTGGAGDRMTLQTSGVNLLDGAKHCLVVTKTAAFGSGAGAGGAMKAFVDGSAASVSFANDNLTTTTASVATPRIGGHPGGEYYSGEMAQFAYYRGLALSPDQVSAVYNGGNPINLLTLLDSVGNLVTWLKPSLSEGDTTSLVVDRASGEHDATPQGTLSGFIAPASFITGGIAVDSFFFNGTNRRLDLAP